MNKKGLEIDFSILFGVFSGLVIFSYLIDLITLKILLLILILPISIFFYFLIKYFLLFKKANKYIKEGQYYKAINIYEKTMLASYIGKEYFRISVYNAAVCYTRLGKFEKSNEILSNLSMEKLSKNLKGMYFGLKANNLLYLDKDLEDAKEYIYNAIRLIQLPSYMLTAAIIEYKTGNVDESDIIINKYINLENRKDFILGLEASVHIDSFSKEVYEKFLLGLYHLLSGSKDLAENLLNDVVKCPYDNYYVSKSKELIEELESS